MSYGLASPKPMFEPMNNETKKFLEFNGKVIYFLGKEGQYWIALKPICEAIGVQYVRQFKNAQKHPMWGQLLSKQTMTGADGKLYKMVSLPERYIYGWLFQIRSESKELLGYQRQCCDLLFDYFHGTITGRKELITEKVKSMVEKEKLMAELSQVPQFQRLMEIAKADKRINTELKAFDRSLMEEQLSLFTNG